MIPPKGSGLELISKALSSKYTGYSLSSKSRTPFRVYKNTDFKPGRGSAMVNPMQSMQTLFRGLASTLPKPMAGKAPITINPMQSMQSLVKGFTSTFSQITKRLVGEDYNSIVKGFLPTDARLLKPQYPSKSEDIEFADLDGDSQDEMITSFRANDTVKTIILKKKNDNWYKTAEINHPEHDTINYRSFADITGEGKKQLLIGLTSKGKAHTIYGYSLSENTPKKLFARNYHWMEIVGQPRNAASKTQLAFWNRADNEAYNIEVLRWNGLQLEQLKDTVPYYNRRVVPHYLRKVKQNPKNSTNWYNLADALIKAEARSDALTAIEVGMGQDRNSALKDKFLSLRNDIT